MASQTVAAAAPSAQARTVEQVGVDPAGASVPAFTWGGYVQALGILFVLLAVLCLTLWAARRFGRFRFLPRSGGLPREALFMEAQLPLGPRRGLMVVRFLNKRLLLGVTEQRITLLSEEQAEHVEHEPDGADFQHLMENARHGADHGAGGDMPAAGAGRGRTGP